jgi:phosphatidylglycerophosphatase A
MKPLKLRPGSLPPGTSPVEPATLIATWFGSGLMPFASGTWGSLAALPFAWAIQTYAGAPGLVVATIVAAIAGTWASNVLVARGGVSDPGFIVIDEVAAMFLTLVAAPQTWWAYLLGFLLFRAADIVKPWPASWCDREVHGGLGVMLDDLVAGLYSCAALWLIARYVPIESAVATLGL